MRPSDARAPASRYRPREESSRPARVLIATNGYSGNALTVASAARDSDRKLSNRHRTVGSRSACIAHSAGPQCRRFAARRRVFQALSRWRAHHLRRPGGAGRKGSARLRAAIAGDDDEDISAIRDGAGHSRLGGLGRIHFRYHAASRASATASITAWVIAGRACRSRRISAAKIGQQMAGLAEGRTALDDLPFPSRPYYFGTPWFLAPSVWAYRTLDAFGI